MKMRPQPKLTDEARTYVVQALACFESPKMVSEAVRRQFGLDITPQSCEAYDPNKRAARNLARRWRILFTSTRGAFLEDVAKIGIANRAARLRALQRVLEISEASGNFALALQVLEQAAKEVGDAYTYRRRPMSPSPGGISEGLGRMLQHRN